MTSRVRVALHAFAILSFAPTAFAQNAQGYVGAGVFLGPWNPEDISFGSPSLSYQNDRGDDLLVLGGTFEAGIRLRRVGLGIEVGVPVRRTVDQLFFYFTPYRKEIGYRESTFFTVARYVTGSDAVGAEFVAGAGLVHQHSVERVAPGRLESSGYTFGAFGPEATVTRWGPGATAGLDLPIRLSPAVALVPQGRVVYVNRGDVAELPNFSSFGLPKTSWRVGLTLRAQF
jgi:hypothetical protein